MGHEFAIVDVFADQPLTGNPLAVVTGADDLDEAQMAAIAVEFNLSETTFVSDPLDPAATWRLRSFTPGGDEVAGAGHNSLGAWWWLAQRGQAEGSGVRQELGGQVLPVGIDADADGRTVVTLQQGPLSLGGAERLDRDRLASALGLSTADLEAAELPTVVGSVGSPHLLVALPDRRRVDACRPDSDRLRQVLADAGAQGCYVYCLLPDSSAAAAYARFFNPTVGISEDPATGSAAGPLAAHLVRAGKATGRVAVEQGHAQGRPSTLVIEVADGGSVSLIGRCVLSAQGTLAV